MARFSKYACWPAPLTNRNWDVLYQRERDYSPVVDALKPVLYDLPGKIIGIGGLPGVGKTTLGRFLAYRFNVSLIETDLFLIRGHGALVYRNEVVDQIILARIEKPRPVIIEGATVLKLLHELGRSADFFVHVTNADAPESHGLRTALQQYEAEYAPSTKADFHVSFEGCE